MKKLIFLFLFLSFGLFSQGQVMQLINIGTVPNDKTGDNLRTVATKTNKGLKELNDTIDFATIAIPSTLSESVRALSAAPSTGNIYFNTVDSTLYCKLGNAWIPIGSSTGSGATPPVDPDLLTGLLAYWKMDDAGTTMTDEVGANDITMVGTAQSSTAILGNSQVFDAAGDYGYVSATGTTTATANMSLSLWFRMTSLPSSLSHASVLAMCIVSADPWFAFVVYIGTDNKPHFAAHNQAGTPYTVDGANALSVNTMYHLVITAGNGETMKIYINGIDVSTSADMFVGTGFLGNRVNLVIGNGGTPGTENIVGIIDEVAPYDAILSPAQVSSHYDDGNGTTHPF